MDALRYYLLRETVFARTAFQLRRLVQRYNSDLANGLGNLASRVLSMIEKYFGGAYRNSGTSATKTWNRGRFRAA